MAKMRGVKPETFTDDKVLRLSPLARWMFIGMWTLACDNGHLEDNAVQLKVRLLPMDNCDVDALLNELLATGQVTRHNGYLKVVKLPEHQRIDKRFLLFCEWCQHDEHPTYTPSDKAPRQAPTQRAHDERTTSTQRAPVDEGEGEGEGELSSPRRKPELPLPTDWTPNDKHKQFAQEQDIDLDTALASFRDHAATNDRRARDWNAAFRTWLRKAKEYGRPPAPTGPTTWTAPTVDEFEYHDE